MKGRRHGPYSLGRPFCWGWLFLLSIVFHAGLMGATLDSIADRQQAKLEDAIERLTKQREAIADEKRPLSEAWRALDEELRVLRREAQEAQAVRDTRSLSIEALEQQVEAQRKELDYVARVLSGEFVAGLESSLSVAELAREGDAVRDHHFLGQDQAVDTEAHMASSLNLMGLATDRIERLLGGERYEGQALDATGRRVDGEFLQVGPLLYFVGPNQVSGWVGETRFLEPRVQALREEHNKDLQTIVETGKGSLPIDPSLGDALEIQATEDSLGQHLSKGGLWVYPIVLFALIATIVGFYKLVQIFSIRQPAPAAIHEIVTLVRQGERAAARSLAEQQPAPSGALLVVGVDHADESIELVEEVLYESMLSVQPRLERWLNVIAVTAATAPLLGLLGTVTGIIKTFKLMQVFGAGDPKPLISGISEALITTELGLVLAIPALLLHALLSRRVAGVLSRLERLSLTFVNGLSRRRLNESSDEGAA